MPPTANERSYEDFFNSEIFCFPLRVGGLPNEAFANDKGLSQCDAKSLEAGWQPRRPRKRL